MPSASQRRENLPILRANSCRDRSFPVAYLQDSRDGKGYPQSHLLCLHLGVARMLKAKRERRERTDNYHLLQQWCRTPEQRPYFLCYALSAPIQSTGICPFSTMETLWGRG